MSRLVSKQRVRIGHPRDGVELLPGKPSAELDDDTILELLEAGNGLGQALVEAGVLVIESTAPPPPSSPPRRKRVERQEPPTPIGEA